MIKLWGGNKNIELNFWTFPGGERNVKIVDPEEILRFKSFTVICDYRGSNDLIDMLLLVNAVRNVSRFTQLRLFMPYFPFARQDRVMTVGEPFALQVAANLIRSCNFTEIEVWDPHSDVLAGMFDPGTLLIRTQWELWEKSLFSEYDRNDILISPDAGALKKIYKLAGKTGLRVVEATKIRDVSTGNIVETKIDVAALETASRCYIIDDICDGGRTFIELAKVIRNGGYTGELELCVTHGIFSKGKEILNEYFDAVTALNDMTIDK